MRKHTLSIMIFLLLAACTNQVTSTPASTPTSTSPSLGDHFPQTNNILGNTDLLVRGELTLENGCLRVSATNTIHGDSFLLIWNSRFSTRTDKGVVQVIDSSTGEVLANVGDHVEVGGGVVVATREVKMALKEPIPKECLEPYWLVGDSIKKIDRP